jgi:predicted nuclease of predicted toxin-antitoxin system
MSQATYRILVDENTSPRVARLLRSNGHDAIHVTGALAVGATDSEIAGHARA